MMIGHFFFAILRTLFNFLDYILIQIFGWSIANGSQKDFEESLINVEKCAHVQEILAKSRVTPVSNVDIHNFILKHVNYVNPLDFVIQNEKCSLININETVAIFGIFEEGLGIYDTKLGPFLYNEQFGRVKQIVTVPLTFVKDLSNYVQEGPAKTILLSNTGRCGSTLLTKMLESCGNTVTMSEPDFLMTLMTVNDDKLTESILDPLFKIQTKGLKGKYVFIKPRSTAVRLAKAVKDFSPEVKHIFMWRKAEKNICSIYSMFAGVVSNPILKNLLIKPWMGKVIKGLVNEYDQPLLDHVNGITDKFDFMEVSVLFWSLHMLCFDRYSKKGGVDFCNIMYEDLLADPVSVMVKINGLVGMQVNPAAEDVKAKYLAVMSKDSQEGSEISKEALDKNRKRSFDQDDIQIVNGVFAKLGLPELSEISDYFRS